MRHPQSVISPINHIVLISGFDPQQVTCASKKENLSETILQRDFLRERFLLRFVTATIPDFTKTNECRMIVEIMGLEYRGTTLQQSSSGDGSWMLTDEMF